MKSRESAHAKKLHFSKQQAIEFGFEAARKNLAYFIVVFFLVMIISLALGFYRVMLLSQHIFLLYFIVTIIIWIFNVVISMGVIKITLTILDFKRPHVLDVFYAYPIVNYIVVSIIRSIIVLAGFVLFIIPGIILAIKLQFAEYLVVDKNMGVTESIKTSWEMTKGVKWNLFLLGILFILINFLGALCLIVGLFLTVPLSMIAEAYVYRKLYSQVK